MKIGKQTFEGYTYVMAIVNLTTDSFWKNSRHDADTALRAVERAVQEGAALVDLGAQSTRPNYTEISAEQEIARLEKTVVEVKRNFDLPVSVDTYFAETAEAALSLGADMINDVWGFSRDRRMAATVAKYHAAACLTHNADRSIAGDIWQPISSFLREAAEKAVKAGVSPDRICLDGGIGFAKTYEQNHELLNGYAKLSALGYPLLLGASRKSLFGGRVEDRLPQTLRSTADAARRGVLFVRVHDVKENVQTIARVYGDDSR